jgi:putative protease
VVKIVELLSPARDFTALAAAINSGADSIYVGVKSYNMRANAANFTVDELGEAVKRCHDSGVKLYVCTNIVMTDSQIDGLRSLMPRLHSQEVDAVIVSDLGACKVASENDVDVHMSVQANLSNVEALKVLEGMGVERAILSRELSLAQIKDMARKTSLEIETFIHGAMCMAVSGRCFLSSYLYDKSANCGECLQPCRKEWKILSEDGHELMLEAKTSGKDVGEKGKNLEQQSKTHILSPRDLCTVEHIPELVEAGIDAFKIEGRARPAEYVATVTSVYREAIDSYLKGSWEIHREEKLQRWLEELQKVFNRGFDTGFYFRTPHETSSYNKATHIKKDVGEVVNYYSKVSAAEIRLWNDLEVGDEIMIQGPTTGSFIQKVESMQINGKNIEKAFKGQNVGIAVEGKVRPHDAVYKRVKRV